MRKWLLPVFAITVLVLSFSGVTRTLAQTVIPTPTPTMVKSDFAVDLEEGEKDIANDQGAKQNQKDQKDNENVGVNEQGEVENNDEQIDEQDMEQSDDDLNEEVDDQQSDTKKTNGTKSETTEEVTGTQNEKTTNETNE